MRLASIEINGFKSFAKKANLAFSAPVTAIVGPNGSGKSNVAEAFRFVLGEQSVKSLRGKKGEDLIFGGGKTMPRLNRAFVKAVFDNSDKRLPIDFDQVSIERIVHRDGLNEYFINGSRVRLKDVSELLAHANIGASGHHIISQGEADRILSATIHERREMIEDALGLKIYHYRKKDSIKKLEKTAENIQQVQSLRREIAPHMNFLRKQVDKLEKARELKEKLEGLCLEYFKRESLYIAAQKKILTEERRQPEHDLNQIEKELSHAERLVSHQHSHDDEKRLAEAHNTLKRLSHEKDVISRELWSIEGELAAIARLQSVQHQKKIPQTVAYHDVEKFINDIEQVLTDAGRERDIAQVFGLLKRAQERINTFFESIQTTRNQSDVVQPDFSDLEHKKKLAETKLNHALSAVQSAEHAVEEIRRSIETHKQHSHDAERAVYELKTKQRECVAQIDTIKHKETLLAHIESEWKKDIAEAGALIGHRITAYESFQIEEGLQESRSAQEDRRRMIEKMKIRLEEAGLGTGEEVLKEYKEVSERDAFLTKELQDLEQASTSLTALITDLDHELTKRFDEGISKINTSFGDFFVTMFGGGEARLDIVKETKRSSHEGADTEGGGVVSESIDEDNEPSSGIEVHVGLPHKRTKGLMMLSGGERALTSIALLFALSQVNPPPFIILDETDAALDEANSRKYGDMIESLARHSQLILITHNRETMSRASTLYGVTMNREGYSTLLSIQFEEAAQVAK